MIWYSSMLLQNPAPFSLYLTPMALLPSHSSLYSFSRLQFLRHNSTKTLHPFKTSISNHNNSSSNSWLQNWKSTHFRPLPKKPKSVLDYRNAVSDDDEELIGTSRSTGSSTMAKIVEKLKKFGYIEDSEEGKGERHSPLPEKGSVEDIFYAEDGILPDSRGGLSLNLEEEVRFPWEKNPGGGEEERRKKKRNTSVAELTLPEGELRRLRHMAMRCKSKTRIKGAGVTQEIVDSIHDKWRSEEVVRLKCEGPAALNMRRIHEILERKTGGLVIRRSGTSISLYRGVSYETAQPEKKPYRSVKMSEVGSFDKTTNSPSGLSKNDSGTMQYSREDRPSPTEKIKDTESPPEVNYESEVDKLLDSIGPRYTDWPGSGPLPVDADLLPGIIPDYKPPFRILPYGVRPSLGYNEATSLRRLARVLPPHFALGRSRQHEGLAAAMLKLWERSSIAKIGLKRGVQLTTSERMAEDIKRLTGCTILSRNKDFLVFYRGKDFLSPEITEALLERERQAKALQDEEEQARQRAYFSVGSMIESIAEPGNAGTLGETLQADARWGNRLNDDHKNNTMRAAEVARHAGLVRKLERKLYIAERKLTKAERALAKVEVFLKPITPTPDPESITDEERFMFRKLGLRMKAFLLLGRRGVFDGTVENMHLHWKYRELVRVLVKAKNFAQVRNVALALEAESGGTLVSVDKVSKGFAIIVYRGKDYHRPPTLRPKNLLTKRKALARSIELQRHEALKHHISKVNRSVEKLKSELGQMEDVKDQGNEDLYAKLDSAYEEEEEEAEEDDNEKDESYLKTFDCGADSSHEHDGEADSYDDDDDDSEADNYFDDDDDADNDDDYSLEDGVLGEFEEEDASSRSSKNACDNKYGREDTDPDSSSRLLI